MPDHPSLIDWPIVTDWRSHVDVPSFLWKVLSLQRVYLGRVAITIRKLALEIDFCEGARSDQNDRKDRATSKKNT